MALLLSTCPAIIPQGAPGLPEPTHRPDRLGNMEEFAKFKDIVMKNAPSSSRGDRLLPFQEDAEDASTEAPSSALCSDAESASGTEGGSDSCADDETQGAPGFRQGPLSLRMLADHKCRQRLSAAARQKPRTRRMAFGSTPLDPIPGTPVGMSEHPPLFFPNASSSGGEESHGEALLSTAPQHGVDPSLVAGAGLWLPTSPKRRARAALMEKAKQEGAPIKVSMQQSEDMAAMRQRELDPMMPAKKRPIFSERLPPRALEPGMPVKKRITPWLVAEPMRLLPAAPR